MRASNLAFSEKKCGYSAAAECSEAEHVVPGQCRGRLRGPSAPPTMYSTEVPVCRLGKSGSGQQKVPASAGVPPVRETAVGATQDTGGVAAPHLLLCPSRWWLKEGTTRDINGHRMAAARASHALHSLT